MNDYSEIHSAGEFNHPTTLDMRGYSALRAGFVGGQFGSGRHVRRKGEGLAGHYVV